MSKLVSVLLGLVALLALIAVLGGIFGDGDIIIGRFILAIVVLVGAAYGAKVMWGRGGSAPPA